MVTFKVGDRVRVERSKVFYEGVVIDIQPRGGPSFQLQLDNGLVNQFLAGEVVSRSLTTMPKYPHVKVRLTGQDGNAFAILGRVIQALRRALPQIPQSEIERFQTEAMAGDYDHMLQTCMRWVDVS